MTVSVPPGYRVGDWTVQRPLAEGAFGAVHSARRAVPRDDLPERVALKFLPTGTSTPRQLRHLRDLVEREVKLLSQVSHPRLIRMYETLTVDDGARPELDGATVLVLEHAERSLADLLDQQGPPVEPEILAQVCEGLLQVHDAGWVHGDLKPANVLLMADGSVRLSDFNLAAELEGTHAYSPAFSTPDYSPPELLWSEFSERGQCIRPTADTWAYGVLVHVALTGTYPMPGGTSGARKEAAARYARGEEELRLSPALPTAWRDIVRRCLAPTHEERLAHTPRALLSSIRAAGAGCQRQPRRWRTPLPFGRRAHWTAVASAATAALLVGASFPLLYGSDDEGEDGKPTASGYERCLDGNVCFFSERDGKGDMCAWFGDDPDWSAGDIRCDWRSDKSVRSIYNNGHDTGQGERYVDVVFFDVVKHKRRLGCVPVQTRVNLASPVRPGSHQWAESC